MVVGSEDTATSICRVTVTHLSTFYLPFSLPKVVAVHLVYSEKEPVLEIDVPAKHRVSGQSIIVECKAYRDRLSADVLTKLLGNVQFLRVSQGWLVTTAALSKDGEGFKRDWESRPPAERDNLVIYAIHNSRMQSLPG